MKEKVWILLIAVLLVSCEYQPGKVKEIRGLWRFTIGDDENWAAIGYDDKDWGKIYIPAYWENQGYRGYNGFAWYRKKITIPERFGKDNLYLFLGRIDDVDEVYFNGKRIGNTGVFPPDYKTAYNVHRKYLIPWDLINFKGENVIAIRIYDGGESGGVYSGLIGIYTNDAVPLDVELSGNWQFRISSRNDLDKDSNADSGWVHIIVPDKWENQGFSSHDGYAIYRKEFDLSKSLLNEKFVLLLGKIDDVDEVYLNGKLVGKTVDFSENESELDSEDYWDESRGYFLPSDVVLKEKGNVLIVRVYDSGGSGGIYESPVGLIRQENYTKFWRNMSKKRYFYEDN